jgi:VanZ family protein
VKIDRLLLYRAAFPILLMASIIWSSGTGGPEIPRALIFPHFDKVGHFFMFGLIGTLIYRVVFKVPGGFRAALFAVALTSLFGAMDEFRQSLNPQRSAHYGDWIADTLGAVVAVAAYRFWPYYRNLLEWPVWGRFVKDFKDAKNCCHR